MCRRKFLMKKTTILTAFIAVLTTLTSITTYAQSTGTITGMVTDKEFNNEPLPQANVLIKGTQKGTVTDFDGLYTISNVEAGSYTLEFSFVGYETKALPVTVVAGETAKINIALAGSAVAMDEVVIKAAPTKRESETALLVQQKKAVEIKESIGAQQLAKLGVSNAAAATTKISGVTKSEGSGDVFVRGLGDRYLYTTLNGLPIPSDDVEKKNIDLGLFPTGLISSVNISKTTSSKISVDQASGNIDIQSRELSGSERIMSLSVSGGGNSNIFSNDVFSNFKSTPNIQNISIGFYNNPLTLKQAITEQSWDTENSSMPMNRSLSFGYGKKFNDKLGLFLTIGQSSSFNYRNAEFKRYNVGYLADYIEDAITWEKNITTSSIVNLKYKFNEDKKDFIKLNSMLINKISDQAYEGGREGNSYIFQQTSQSDLFQFIRDLNTKTNTLIVNQLHGEHELNEKNYLKWGLSYNNLNADEPNRIRSEINFNKETDFIQLGYRNGYQQRKSNLYIQDDDYNGMLNHLIKVYDEDDMAFKINYGVNYRQKDRSFKSRSIGVKENDPSSSRLTSLDNVSDFFTTENFNNGTIRYKDKLKTDTYDATLNSLGVYTDFNLNFEKLFIQLGLRYQKDDIFINFDVNNYKNDGKGESEKKYEKLYPSVNIKYSLNEKVNIRFSNSLTNTLPEFKEIAPFTYVPSVGRKSLGNPNIKASTNRNYDLKFEFFPNKGQIVSLTGFYKHIKDPINKVMARGAIEALSYFNTSKRAEIKGLEAEMKLELLKQQDEDEDEFSEIQKPSLGLNLNITRMWHKQDLKSLEEDGIRSFRYSTLTETGLQGASNWISNVSLSYSNNKENPFRATLTANYASDKIFSLGNAVSEELADVTYDNEIIEAGFAVVDLILSKKLNDKLSINISGKNLLNPTIKQTQLIPIVDNSDVKSPIKGERKENVFSYKRGTNISLGLSYKF